MSLIASANNVHQAVLRHRGLRPARGTAIKPKFTNAKGIISFTHTEFLVAVTGSTTHAISGNWNITPTNHTLFPWLSTMGLSFDEYRFASVQVNYHAVRGKDEDGEIAFSYMKDAGTTVPTSRSTELDTDWSKVSPVSQSKSFTVPLKSGKWLKVQPKSTLHEEEEWSAGRLTMSTSYCTAQVVGEVTLTYSIEFRTPSGNDNHTIYYDGNTTASDDDFFNVEMEVADHKMGSGMVKITGDSELTFYLPGEYMILYRISGTDLTEVASYSGTAVTSTSSALHNAATDPTSNVNAALTKLVGYVYATVEYADTLIIRMPSSTTVTICKLNIMRFNNKDLAINS